MAWAQDRIVSTLSSRKPRSSSSLTRCSHKSLPKTLVSREERKSYFAVYVLTSLGQVTFQIPQLRTFVNLMGHLLCSLHYILESRFRAASKTAMAFSGLDQVGWFG
jgi:hypothetical protein